MRIVNSPIGNLPLHGGHPEVASAADVNRSCEQGINQIGASIERFGIEIVRPYDMLESATCDTNQCNGVGEVRKIGQMDSNWSTALTVAASRTAAACSQRK